MSYNVPINDFTNDVSIRHLTLSMSHRYSKIGGIDIYLKDMSTQMLERIKCTDSIKKTCDLINQLLKFKAVNFRKTFDTPFSQNIIDNISIIGVFLGNELIAIGNVDETMFLLKRDLTEDEYIDKAKIIDKKDLFDYIQIVLIKNAKKYIKDFSCNVKIISDFIINHKQYVPDLNIEEYNEFLTHVSALNKLLNKKEE